jgi:heptosyltransferase-1
MRVLLVRLGAFGDIVHTLPPAADLATAGHRVDWLCEDRWACVLDGSPVIGRVHHLPRKLLRTAALVERMRVLSRLVRSLRAEAYDVVIDAQGLAKSAGLSVLAGAGRRIAHAPPRGRELSWLGADCCVRPQAVHVIDQQRDLGLGLGTTPQGGWRFPLPDWRGERRWARDWLDAQALRRPWMLNVGAGWPTKVWPAERLRGFTSACAAAHRPLVLLWGNAAERTIASDLVAHGGILAPDSSIPQLAGLLFEAAVLVSGDTGPLHLARALGTPAVGLFGPVPLERNGPRGADWRNFQAPGAAWERRDVSKVDMGAISVEQVCAAASEVARA